MNANQARNSANLLRWTALTANCIVPDDRTRTTVATPTVLASTTSWKGGQTGVAARKVR